MFDAPRKLNASQIRQSSRISNLEENRSLDESTRRNRRARQLDGLEQDNSHDDPHANIVWNKAAPKFEDELSPAVKKIKKTGKEEKVGSISVTNDKARRRKLARPEFNKQRFKKSFIMHVEEQSKAIEESVDPDFRRVDAYESATAPPSTKPPRKFCAVCGLLSKYCCTKCGAKYCSLPCRDVHNDTRCMKWLS